MSLRIVVYVMFLFCVARAGAAQDNATRVNDLYKVAYSHYSANRRDEVRQTVRAACELLNASNVPYESWRDFGVLAWAIGDFESATRIYQCLISIFQQSKDGVPLERTPTYFIEVQRFRATLAGAQSELGQVKAARAIQQGVVSRFLDTTDAEMYGESNREVLLAEARRELAITETRLGHAREAEQLHGQVVEFLKGQGEQSEFLQKARRDHANAIDDVEKGNPESLILRREAVAAYEKHFPKSKELHVARAELALSRYGRRQDGDLEHAYRMARDALHVLEHEFKLPDSDTDLMYARRALGDILRMRGDLQMSRQLLERDLAARVKYLPEHHYMTQAARDSMGLTCFFLGEYAEARRHFQAAIDSLTGRVSEDDGYFLDTKENLAAVLVMQGEHDKAIPLLEEVIKRYTAMKSGRLCHASGDLGAALCAAGRHADAIKRFSIAFQGVDDIEGLDRHWFQAANVAYFRRAYLLSLAALGDEKGLEEQIERTIDIGAEAYQRSHCLSIREMEQIQASVAQSLEEVFWLVPAKHNEARRKIFELLETMRGAPAQALSQLNRLPKEIDELRKEALGKALHVEALAAGTDRKSLSDAVALRDKAQDELWQKMSDLRFRRQEVKVRSLAGVLKRDRALITFHRTARWSVVAGKGLQQTDDLLAIALHDGVLSHHRVGSIEEVRKVVREWRKGLGVQDAGEAGKPDAALRDKAAARLYELVLDPALRGMKKKPKYLHVCMDDVLHLVPLEALPVVDKKRKGKPRLVGEDYRVRYHVSLDSMMRRVDPLLAPGKKPAVVLVGDVEYAKAAADRWKKLDTKDEVARVSRAFRGADVRKLTGSKATAAALREAIVDARYVHFATHYHAGLPGQRDPRDDEVQLTPISSLVHQLAPLSLAGVVLAGAADTTLSAEQIAGLDLGKCELAVLPHGADFAGVDHAGPRIRDLQRAFRGAGVQATLISLWESPRAAEFLSAFYTRLRKEKSDPDKAQVLWDTMRQLERQKWEPRDWAGWALTAPARR